MAKEDREERLEAQLAAQQEQIAALLSLVSKIQTGVQPVKSGPRVEPKGLQEVRFIDERGNTRRAWLEARRTIQLVEGTNEKNKVVHEMEVADVCVELRPGKFHSIEGVPGLDVKRAGHLVNQMRWCTLEQERGFKQYQQMLKSTSTPAPAAKPAPADSDLGLKGT